MSEGGDEPGPGGVEVIFILFSKVRKYVRCRREPEARGTSYLVVFEPSRT